MDRTWTGDTKPTGCSKIDRYTFGNLAGRGGTAYAWLLYPTAAALGKVMVCHAGHKQTWDGDNLGDAARTLENTVFWLALGFHVLALDMPTTTAPARNPNPLTLTVAGASTQFTTHAYAALDADSGPTTAMAVYLEPAIRAVNQALLDLPTLLVYAIGLSGGGWTTEFMAALDTRIRNRYSVFGSMPWEVRPVAATDMTDYEQYQGNPIYLRGGLHAVRYALGADHGRRAVQVWGDGDPTFSSTGKHQELDAHGTYVGTLLNGAGTYVIRYDAVAAAHQYTDDTLNWIWSDIQAHP